MGDAVPRGKIGVLPGFRISAGLVATVAVALLQSGCAPQQPSASSSGGLSLTITPAPAQADATASATGLSLAATEPVTTLPAAAAAPVLPMPAAIVEEPKAPKTRLSSIGSLEVERENAVAKIGKPYKVAGLWYVPKHQPDYDETGIASWYGPTFHGKSTANGEIYNQSRLTAAHPTLPMPCLVEVTNLANGRKIVVRVNDRGPYKRGRILDLSAKAAKLLGYQGNGTAEVRVRYVGKAPLNGDDRAEQEFLSKQAWYTGGGAGAPKTEVAEVDFSAAIDMGDPAPDLTAPASQQPAPVLKAPVVAAAAEPIRLKRVASSK